MALKVGIDYHPRGGADGGYLDPCEAARLVEEVGLDGFWIADNLVREGKPILECMLVLAAAGAVTERIDIAVGVIQVPLRRTVWLAKEVQTLQVLTGGRFVFGVGIGGTFPEEWATVGVTTKRRGATGDAMLEVLPALLRGEPTEVPDGEGKVTLLPGVEVPPLWCGGGTPGAKRRTARFCDGWLPAKLMPEQLKAQAVEVAELAAEYGRPAPRTGVQLHGDLTVAHGSERHRELGAWAESRFKVEAGRGEEYVLVGNAEQVAERLAAYEEAGAELAVIAAEGPGWLRQCEVLGEARRLLG